MSPEYVRRFVERNRLHQPPIDVFSKLRERITWLLRSGGLPTSPSVQIIHGDAANVGALLDQRGIRSVGAIVTSPPYLGVLRYGAFNWIRLWFLGYDQYRIDRLLQTSDSLDTYLSFMASFLSAAARVLRPGALAALVIGDVIEHGQHVPLAERVWQELRGLVPFELIECSIDAYNQSSKTTRVWGDARKGRATPNDRVLVLQRVTARRKASSADAIAGSTQHPVRAA
jgi:site-specific DNA-methyltransferase (adenine-specific)